MYIESYYFTIHLVCFGHLVLISDIIILANKLFVYQLAYRLINKNFETPQLPVKSAGLLQEDW